jgi:hypothetical protein
MLVGGGMALSGCHVSATAVCSYFKPHTGDSLAFADFKAMSDGWTGYRCGYLHPGGGYHRICVEEVHDGYFKRNNCAYVPFVRS